jgi:endoglycosylceramidase
MFISTSKWMGLCASVLTFNQVCAKLHVDSDTRMIRDETGRAVLLHGVNVVYKVDPYIPMMEHFDAQDSLTEEDIADLKSWGMNFVRLGVMWEAVERSEGHYDMEYLAKVDALITRMGEQGIYTLVDAH